jgi:hypothetical protein
MTHTTSTPDLPQRPEPNVKEGDAVDCVAQRDYYTDDQLEDYADQMRAYGLACIAATHPAPAGDAVAVLREAADTLSENNWRGDLVETLRDMATERAATQPAGG